MRRLAPLCWLLPCILAGCVHGGRGGEALAPGYLAPMPQEVTMLGGALDVRGGFQAAMGGEGREASPHLRSLVDSIGAELRTSHATKAVPVRLVVEDGGESNPEAHALHIGPDGIRLTGASPLALQHGLMTLRQIVQNHRERGCLPCMRIEDAPAFPVRGMLIDISRNRAPTMAALMETVELLASLKYNMLQLYMEHTFAYAGHEVVWRGASPFTGEEIRALDAHCRAWGIRLVPCQNTLGHMERWLRHPAYEPLAEMPGGGTCLNPADERALALVTGLLDQLTPHFSSRSVNICGDEVLELGKGRSAGAVAASSAGQVYLDYILGLRNHLAAKGLRCQFWGDMLVPFDAALRAQRAPLLAQVPPDMTALVWGYRPDDPLHEQARAFARAGIPFLVCPGSSAWTSFTGRTARMGGNVRLAAEAAREHGARGMLMTDWTIHGWEHPVFSLPGYLYAAAMAWNPGHDPWDQLGPALDVLFLGGAGAGLGDVLLDLGMVYADLGCVDKNVPPHFAVVLDPSLEWSGAFLACTDPDRVRQAIVRIGLALERMDAAAPRTAAGLRSQAEMRNGAHLARAACRMLLHRLTHTDPAQEHPHAAEAQAALDTFRTLWHGTFRPGGFEESFGVLSAGLCPGR